MLLFNEMELGNCLFITLEQGMEVDSKEVLDTVENLLSSYSSIIVRSHDKKEEKVFENELVDFESMMVHHSYGRPSKLSRQVKAQEANLDY